jgi:putative oxidoreductase
MSSLFAWSPRILSVLRIVTALCFMEHGLMKLLHFPIAQPGAPNPLPPMLLVAGCLELIGGGMLVVGLLSRAVAFLLSGEMAVAYFMAHFPQSPYPAVNMGEAAVLYCFIFFYIFFAGPGPWSLDALVFRNRVAVAA